MAADQSDPQNRLTELCRTFEAAWRESRAPQIEDYLKSASGSEHDALLRALLTTEVELRMRAGQTVRAAEYMERFPQSADVVWAILSKAETYLHPPAADSPSLSSEAHVHASPLALSPLFRSVPQEVLATHMFPRQFAPGEALLQQGETSDELLLITDGQVEISSRDVHGQRRVIDRSGQGDILGEMALLTSEPRTADAVAVDHVRVLVLPSERFHELAKTYPRLSAYLSELVARRLGVGSRDALIDKVLDRYRIVRRLGRGGMGIVYEAEELGSGRQVALKMMGHRLVYDADALARFQREADVIQSLNHPNIVQMLGRFAAFHTYFLVLEHCRGKTLDNVLLNQGSLTEPQVRSILGQLAAALAAAHQAGVVHRDVKPANIMLLGDGAVKLMDFGLAEPASAHEGSAQRIAGTPRYMAPEQRAGQDAGREGDYFAFGCVAYELLTGQPLFRGSDADELARDFRSWQPPDLRALRSDLSEETCSLLAPALRPMPGDRRLDLTQIAAWAESR